MADEATRVNKMERVKKVNETTDFHEYEIRLTQRLQSNNDVLRRKALKEVDKWLKIRMDSEGGPLNPESFVLWKGLFYALWMSDKPLVQEQIAQRISSFVNLTNPMRSIEFFKYGFSILCCEWFRIDQLRVDRFLMFARRYLRNGLIVIKNSKYSIEVFTSFNKALSDTVLNKELIVQHNCMCLTLHIIEIFLEELAKVSEGKLQPCLVPLFIKPFTEFLAFSEDRRLIHSIKKNIFRYLLKQSDTGQEYEEKSNTWSELWCPGGSINTIQKIEVPFNKENDSKEDTKEEQQGEKVLDPRAGRVDVVLPQIKFIPEDICEMVEQYRFVKGTNSKSREAIASIITLFKEMSYGNFPRLQKVNISKEDPRTRVKKALKRLAKFEKEVIAMKRKYHAELEEEETIKRKKPKLSDENKEMKKPLKSLNKKADEKSNSVEFDPQNYDNSFECSSGTSYVYNLKDSEDKNNLYVENNLNDKNLTENKNKEVNKTTNNVIFSENNWNTQDMKEKPFKKPKSPNVIIQSVVILEPPNKLPQSTSSSAKSQN